MFSWLALRFFFASCSRFLYLPHFKLPEWYFSRVSALLAPGYCCLGAFLEQVASSPELDSPILKGVEVTIAGLARPVGTKQEEDGFRDLPLPKTAAPLPGSRPGMFYCTGIIGMKSAGAAL